MILITVVIFQLTNEVQMLVGGVGGGVGGGGRSIGDERRQRKQTRNISLMAIVEIRECLTFNRIYAKYNLLRCHHTITGEPQSIRN